MLTGRITDLLGVAVHLYVYANWSALKKQQKELNIFRSEARITHDICSSLREIVGQPTRCKAKEIIYVILNKKDRADRALARTLNE